ncbi:ubiquitin protein ligase E3 component n-recognin 7 [Pelomyxa schiedti]|nr:ubiquitin protein ligase E3 component n-recognin 7 [Pelomyxa schiedti]
MSDKEGGAAEAATTTCCTTTTTSTATTATNDGAQDEITVTAVDLVEDINQLEKEAEEVIGEHWGEEGICTYDQGYKNQALYSCLTCGSADKPVGVCFGCSLRCHVDHNIVELYFKHGFRCDCGSSKIATPDSKCCFNTSGFPRPSNTENRYGHNFQGLFCWCNKLYDPATIMFQCVACEEWYHNYCLTENGKSPMPSEDDFADLICKDCIQRCPFLLCYPELQVNAEGIPTTEKTPTETSATKELTGTGCNMSALALKKAETMTKEAPCNTYWRSAWQHSICRCEGCTLKYTQTPFPWLFEVLKKNIESESHPVAVATKAVPASIITTAQALLMDSVEPTKQRELVHGYNVFATSLHDYLKGLQDSGHTTITKEDIDGFTQMMAKRRRF